jgi:hypothetical protein
VIDVGTCAALVLLGTVVGIMAGYRLAWLDLTGRGRRSRRVRLWAPTMDGFIVDESPTGPTRSVTVKGWVR